MKIYWSARKIPSLANFRATERAQIIQKAARAMPLPRRFFTNTLKLIVLIVLFWQLTSVEGWTLRILALVAAGLFYPLLLHPLTLNLALPYVPQAAEDFRAHKDEQNSTEEDEQSSGR